MWTSVLNSIDLAAPTTYYKQTRRSIYTKLGEDILEICISEAQRRTQVCKRKGKEQGREVIVRSELVPSGVDMGRKQRQVEGRRVGVGSGDAGRRWREGVSSVNGGENVG